MELSSNIRKRSLSAWFLITASMPCYAEGQGGMAEFYFIAYTFTFLGYVFIIANLILFTRKFLYRNNSRSIKIISYALGAVAAILFYLIDDFHFLPLFWFY